MSKKSGIGKFIAGAAIGAGLGVLFAPKKGSETRNDLKKKIDELVANIKNIDADDVKREFEEKIGCIKKELEDLDKEKVLKMAKKKGKELQKQAEDLVNMAVEKGTPVLKDAAEEIRLKTIEVVEEVLKKLEEAEIK